MSKKKQARSVRLLTGVPGFDAVLQGGLFRGGVYLVRGSPGAGKTILGNQICFAHARNGGRATYVTLLAEAHARMMLHLESLDFFDPDLIDGRVQYFSGYNTLEADGLRGVLELLRRELRSSKTSVLVVDGLVALRESAATAVELKKFIHELQLHADLVGCAVLLLTGPAEPGIHPENTMVDGIFELVEQRHDVRTGRQIVVHKFRGNCHLRGAHSFNITGTGITVFPRIESLYASPSLDDAGSNMRVSTGVDGLDKMLEGGLPEGTTTMLLGPSGSGKTTLGLHYLAAAEPGEKSMYFGFYETPGRLLSKAQSLGLPLSRRVKTGELSVLWQASTELSVDELGHRLLNALERTGAKRLFIDGLDGFQKATVHKDRVHHVFTALANELRVRGVTTMYSFESPQFLGPELNTPMHSISTLVENLLCLRFVEYESRLYRLLSILKVRNSAYDSTLREFRIGARGISLEMTFEGVEGLMSGGARAPVVVAHEKTPSKKKKAR